MVAGPDESLRFSDRSSGWCLRSAAFPAPDTRLAPVAISMTTVLLNQCSKNEAKPSAVNY